MKKLDLYWEANFTDFVDSHNWRIEDSQGKSIKILCPIFHDNNQITWQEDGTLNRKKRNF